MTKRTTTLLVGAAFVGWSAWLALVVYVPPEQRWTKPLFLGLGLLALSATGTLAAWLVDNRHRAPGEDGPRFGHAAFQGTGLAAAFTITLWLQAERMLSPLHVILLFGSFWLANLLLWSGRSPR